MLIVVAFVLLVFLPSTSKNLLTFVVYSGSRWDTENFHACYIPSGR